jgi:hypothetical protein
MKIYIAGPYTKPDPVVNTRNAILAGEEIIKLGHIPFVPHLNHLWHMVSPHEEDFWYAYDLVWLRCCHGLLRLPGASKGADIEVDEARMMNIPIYYSLKEIPLW